MSQVLSEKIFNILKTHIFNKCSWDHSPLHQEEESREYEASVFTLNQLNIKVRTAKRTPKKNGQFVTLWKRDDKGVTCPHDLSDAIDIFVVNVEAGDSLGQFVFPKSILHKKKIISDKGIGGKRGIRVYPPWDSPKSVQAEKTQLWQLEWFLDLSKSPSLDSKRAKKLYSEYIQ